MFARQTFIKVQPEKVEELKKIFDSEIAPVLKAQPGNVDLFLLEPTNKNDEYVSVSMWESKADADKYEKSGKFAELSGKVKPILTKPLEVKTYEIKKEFSTSPSR